MNMKLSQVKYSGGKIVPGWGQLEIKEWSKEIDE